MGNNPPLIKLEQSSDNTMTYFLKQFKVSTSKNGVEIKSTSYGSKIVVFERQQSNNHKLNCQMKNNKYVAVNSQTISRQKTANEFESFKGQVEYYKKRLLLTQSGLQMTQGFQNSIVRLVHYQIRNLTSDQKIFPPSKVHTSQSTNQANKKSTLPTCGFQNIFTQRPLYPQPSMNYIKNQLYTFTFIQQFNSNCLQKQIQCRLQNDEYFQQKQIWSLIYCCCQAALKMTQAGMKEPMLSPAAIFINEQSEIKVAEWEFINYYQSQVNDVDANNFQSAFQEEGETFVSMDLEMTINHSKNTECFDILTRYYWPPEGIVQMQNNLKLGELIQAQKLSEVKNSQVFSLGMTVLQMLTLRKYYQRATYSERQLRRLINQAEQIRTQITQSLSNQMNELLTKMLEWDPLQRFTYKQVIEYIYQMFQNDNLMFNDSESRQITMRSSRTFRNQNRSNSKVQEYNTSKELQKSKKQVISLAGQKKASRHFDRITEKNPENKFVFSIQQDFKLKNSPSNRDENLRNSCQKFNLKKDELEGSGIIFQGQGDDYDPLVEQREEYVQSKVQKCIFPVAHDIQDVPNTLNSYFSHTSQLQLPDLDVDFEPGYSAEQTSQSEYSQSYKKQIRSQNKPIQQVHHQSAQKEFEIFNYVPSPKWKKDSVNSPDHNFYKGKNFIDAQNLSFCRSQELSLSNLQKQYQNLKKNIEFRPSNFQLDKSKTFSSANNNLSSSPFDKIVKQTTSPYSQKGIQNKENYIYSKNQEKNLFTSPDLLAVIRQFTKKDGQQTPNFQSIRLSTQKLSSNRDFMDSKKLLFEQKPFDNCFIDSNQNITNFSNQTLKLSDQNSLEKTNSSNQLFVKQQFSKGSYKGTKKNGARNGFGTFYYKEGGKYCGYWYNNKMDGHGTLYYPDGRVAYEGQWKNDSLHGKGVLHNENPTLVHGEYDFSSFDQCQNEECWISYDGWFENDQKSGYGQLLLSNNQKYVGEFKNDMVHGNGKFYLQNGSIFQGEWQSNHLITE